MSEAEVRDLISRVEAQRLIDDVLYLARDPLPFRKVNYTRPGQSKCSLDEADDFIEARLASLGYQTERETSPVQAIRCDETKPKSQQYSAALPDDPWYDARNVYGKKLGREVPDEIIVVISHKDSQSWVDSPGANDNCIGTVANMEIARVLADYPLRRTIWFLYCNEEHFPWSSATAANNARERGDNIIAVLNLDSAGGKSYEDQIAKRPTNVTAYTGPEGEVLADLMAEVNERYGIGLHQSKYAREFPNDDDGSFFKAGYLAAVISVGSFPYADPCYHAECDTAEHCDYENAAMVAQAHVAAILALDENGFPGR
jgi:hypothetical protein